MKRMIENKMLIEKLFDSMERKIKNRELSDKLSKCARLRHKNGRLLDVFLLYLSDGKASIAFVDVKTKVEISTIDILDSDLQYPNLTYEEACEIYDNILKVSVISKRK